MKLEMDGLRSQVNNLAAAMKSHDALMESISGAIQQAVEEKDTLRVELQAA